MTLPIEQSSLLIEQLNDEGIGHLIAQSDAKHVLYEVSEAEGNFQNFDENLHEKITFLAYSWLAAGCSKIETGSTDNCYPVLERSASLLHNVHSPFAKGDTGCAFHVLIAAMAFYISGQYSRAYVTIKKVDLESDIARLVGTFIRKEIDELLKIANNITIRKPNIIDSRSFDEWVVTETIAKSFHYVVEFILTGRQELLVEAKKKLTYASIIAANSMLSGHWWATRLLMLMFDSLRDASLWSSLPSHFNDSGSGLVLNYIKLLACQEKPIFELWRSQLQSLPLALGRDNRGAIINLKTSGGKTRVAELAILQALEANPKSKILYLAPFRSLAIEIEQTLSAVFNKLGFQVSHLYGGARFSAVDSILSEEASIVIATPEKARIMFRIAPEFFNDVSLIVVDEGHLLGVSERYIKNELFLDHLNAFARASNARVLLLSAVLPNGNELSEWITSSPELVAVSDYKPSAERFGILKWTGKKVWIGWKGEFESFNPSFVEPFSLGFGRRRNPFPNNKREAIAASAIKLTSVGPVMIFTGRANSVSGIAKSVLLALGETPASHDWPKREWNIFEAVCSEELPEGAIELIAARAGVICHSAKLTNQVRMATEMLMRVAQPKVIVATTTLGQGVNIGVSSVIVASPYTGSDPINNRDFWNICGRAGRAFVDGEGKILYAIDETEPRRKVRKNRNLANDYFQGKPEPVNSGLLTAINELRRIASEAGVDFNDLLEMIAENEFTELGDSGNIFHEVLDLLDDELLALHVSEILNSANESPEVWVENVFRESLAAIQAREKKLLCDADDVIAFLTRRAEYSINQVWNPDTQKIIVTSGVPVSIGAQLVNDLDRFAEWASRLSEAEYTIESLTEILSNIEDWAREHASAIVGDAPDAKVLNKLRYGWLSGVSLRELTELESSAADISKELYGYQLPWLINGAAHILRTSGQDKLSGSLSKLALLVELGLPNDIASNIFLTGVRSRRSAVELANCGVSLGNSVIEIRKNIGSPVVMEQLIKACSQVAINWVYILQNSNSITFQVSPRFSAFRLPKELDDSVIYPRSDGDNFYLTTLDGSRKFIRKRVQPELPFDEVLNDYRYKFRREGRIWRLVCDDPSQIDVLRLKEDSLVPEEVKVIKQDVDQLNGGS